MQEVKRYEYCIVDVFAEAPYRGNQLAVVINDGTLSDADMLSITQEMHYSETVFIETQTLHAEEKKIRIFTPPAEVPFAGHPCLGAAFCISRAIEKTCGAIEMNQTWETMGNLKNLSGDIELNQTDGVPRNSKSFSSSIDVSDKKITLKTKAGLIPVLRKQTDAKPVWWMEQLQPEFGRNVSVTEMARILGLSTEQFDTAYPVQWVSTGLPFLLVPLKNLSAVRSAAVDWEIFHATLSGLLGDVMLFTRETEDSSKDLHVRVLVDFPGIPEDPATGSANGCLAGYIVNYGYLGAEQVRYTVEQGIEMGRPSVLHVAASKHNDRYSIQVGGEVFLIAQGELLWYRETEIRESQR